MSGLRTLQQRFQGYLLAPRPDNAVAEVAAAGERARKRRLDIYADAYRLRLVEVLEGDYPALKATLGESAFTALALAYVDRFPSRSPSLRWYGQHMPEHAATQLKARADADFLVELARFEWLQAAVFDAVDDAVLTAEDLAATPAEAWPELVLRFHPSVHWVVFIYSTPQCWSDAMAGQAPQPAASELPWILWRSALDIHWRSLAADEHWALQCAARGRRFEALCEGLCHWHEPEAAAGRAAALLARWLEDGLLSEARRAGAA